jgi:hypothetical protein
MTPYFVLFKCVLINANFGTHNTQYTNHFMKSKEMMRNIVAGHDATIINSDTTDA